MAAFTWPPAAPSDARASSRVQPQASMTMFCARTRSFSFDCLTSTMRFS